MDAKSRLGRIDFQRMFSDYCQLEVFKGAFDEVGLPTLTLTWGRVPKKGAIGSCTMRKVGKDMDTVRPGKPTSRSHITINIPPNGTVADVIQTTMHELTHAAGWMDHSHRFYNTLRAAVDAAHGVDCDHEWSKVYEYDEAQRDALDEVFGDDMSSLPLLPEGQTYENKAKPRKKRKGKQATFVLPEIDFDSIREIARSAGKPKVDIFAEVMNGEA